MNITAPPDSRKSYAFAGREIQVYTPNINEDDIYDAGKFGEQVEQFLSLGFATPAADLQKMYNITVAGQEDIGGEKTVRLQLTPKTGEAKKYIKEVDLWIGNGNYPVQEKVVEPSGDYTLYAFSDVRINPPDLKPADVKLNLPTDVHRVHP